MHTKKMEGLRARRVSWTPSIFTTVRAMKSAPQYSSSDAARPMPANSASAVRKMRSAPSRSSRASRSDTILEMALGMPTDEMASSMV